jgi:hypothetical protein
MGFMHQRRGVFFVINKLTVAGNFGAAFGADTLSPSTNVSWKNILSKTKNQHHNCLLLPAAILIPAFDQIFKNILTI